MENNGIPLVNVPLGPGSQDEGDMVLDYMKMPSEMSSYDMPILPEAEDAANCPQALAVMEKLQGALAKYRVGEDKISIDLTALPESDLLFLNQILGEGEVAVSIEGEPIVRAQETVLAGVWRLREISASGDVLAESIQVADVPGCVLEKAWSSEKVISFSQDQLPQGVLNAPSVLVEIHEASEKFRLEAEASTPHVINLSLLPFSPEDHQFLSEIVGIGPVTILSRGYGNCRITSTDIRGLWRVQYFNSTDQLILDTLEITDIPLVACAAQEDLDDSAERLHEIREVLL